MGLNLRLEPRDAPAFRREVSGEAVVLGRSSKADVVLADRFLSRLHARLFQRDGAWFVEDLGSRNTTFLNERPLAGPAVVRPGDVIRLAESRVVIEPSGAAESSDTEDGLTGSSEENLPGRTILRSAEQLMSAGSLFRGGEASFAGRLKLLNELHRSLARPITLEALLELTLDRAFSELLPEEGAIFLRRSGGGLERAASRRAPGTGGDYLYSRRLAQEVTEKGVAALVADASLDARFAASESIVVSGARSIVAAPLLDSEGCLGMIVLSAKRRARPFGEDDLELLVAFASAAALRIRNLALGEETARRRLLDKELELAHDIQMGMLPRSFPARPELDVAAELRPARSVGGDFYDVVEDGGSVWLLIGDVSGKGVGAALFMAVTKTLFRAVAPGASSVSEVVGRVNRELARDNERAMFVTVFAARLELATGELEFVNAGHSPTYRIGTQGCAPLAGPVDPALGALASHAYRSQRLRLEAGEALLLYTDGVVEARNAGDEEFQARRLEEYLRASRGLAAASSLVQGLVERVYEFAGEVAQYDDVTVLALRYLGVPGAPR